MEELPPRPASALLSDAIQALSDLVRGEIALAKAEMTDKFRQAGAGVGLVVAGAVVGLVALNTLAGAAVAGLVAQGIAPGWAGLIVAAGAAVLALVLIGLGRKALSPGNLMPRRTARNVRRDATTVKETLNHDTSH